MKLGGTRNVFLKVFPQTMTAAQCIKKILDTKVWLIRDAIHFCKNHQREIFAALKTSSKVFGIREQVEAFFEFCEGLSMLYVLFKAPDMSPRLRDDELKKCLVIFNSFRLASSGIDYMAHTVNTLTLYEEILSFCAVYLRPMPHLLVFSVMLDYSLSKRHDIRGICEAQFD